MAVRVAVHRSWCVAFGIGILFVALAFLHPLRTDAATITVTNANDTTSTGDGVSLREAILSINGGRTSTRMSSPSGRTARMTRSSSISPPMETSRRSA
ncbi:MAG: hypothetical protein ACR2M3_21070 [Thermomicrobiales bacterium]